MLCVGGSTHWGMHRGMVGRPKQSNFNDLRRGDGGAVHQVRLKAWACCAWVDPLIGICTVKWSGAKNSQILKICGIAIAALCRH